MFALTKKTDYAIIALSHMAQSPDRVCNAREIAERFHVPPAVLTNVLKTLTQKELARSVRGAKGGYRLALPAERITLEAIIQAVEGPVRFVQCASDPATGEAPCDLTDVCPVTRPVQKVHARLTAFLNAVTLADIAHDPCYGDVSVSVEMGLLNEHGIRKGIANCDL
ncbi:MAG: RrF2 family transcriptional regulator [Phycisphaerae bacterium]